MVTPPGALTEALSRFRAAAERTGTRFLNRVAGPQAHFVYHPAFRVPESEAVDPNRGRKILAYLLEHGAASQRTIRRARRVTLPELTSVHRTEYLAALDDAEEVERVLGRLPTPQIAQRFVEQQRWMTGGTLVATVRALQGGFGGPSWVCLGGGLHHAYPDRGEGFCLFNDVAVAISAARQSGFRGPVLVLDLDLHQGNGTRAIYADDPTVFTVSVHANSWDDRPAVANIDVALGTAIGDRAYLATLREVIPEAFDRARPALVFYLGGVDVAIDDALGSWRVTPDAIFARDRLVLDHIGSIPHVWLLAGGYGDEAWRHSARSLCFRSRGTAASIPTETEASLHRFRAIAAKLPKEKLTTDPGQAFEVDLQDLMLDLGTAPPPTRFLGYYSRYGVEVAFEQYGVLRALRDRGFTELEVEFELDHPTGQLLRIRSATGRRDTLVELAVKESTHDGFRLLYIEWLLMQNPRAKPTADRPLLPDQRHPGLGLLDKVMLILQMTCERLNLDGLAFNPAHYHVAAVAKGSASFIDPSYEGLFRSLAPALERLPLAVASAAVDKGAVIDEATGEPFQWRGETMALAASPALRERLSGEAYEQAALSARRSFVLTGEPRGP